MSRFRTGFCILLAAAAALLSSCGSRLTVSFEDQSRLSNFNFLVNESGSGEVAEPFAGSLCVIDGDNISASLKDIGTDTSAALFDLNRQNVLYAKDAFTQVYPASLTKIMTALVALENADLDTVLTASADVIMTDPSAQSAGLQEGDTLTLDQALHMLLIHSDNDVAILIAENIAGSTDQYVDLMNEEAEKLGATNTNFINSNGLTDENHYTTVYDMYLIFNQTLQFQVFNEIIAMSEYSTVYHHADGTEAEIKEYSTNNYNTAIIDPPAGITVIGGKTGTTIAAGHNLILYVRDSSGNPYIAIVMHADDSESCYAVMNELLEVIGQQTAEVVTPGGTEQEEADST